MSELVAGHKPSISGGLRVICREMGIRTHTGSDGDTSMCISNLVQLEAIKNEIEALLAKRDYALFKSFYMAIKNPYTNIC